MPTYLRAPVATWLGLLLLAFAAEALSLANRATWHGVSDAGGVGFTFALTYGLAGALILARRRRNPVGRVFMYLTAVMVVSQLSSEYAVYAYVTRPSQLPLRLLAAWLSQWTFFLGFPIGLSMVFLLFPDGIKPGKRWRFVLGLAGLGAVLLTASFMATAGPVNVGDRGNGILFLPVDNPTGLLSQHDHGPAGTLQGLGWLLSGMALILSVASSLIRLSQEQGERRQQLKWVAYFAAPVAPAFAIHFVDLAIFNGAFPDYTQPIYVAIFIAGIPLAMAIAILKYRLYGIDVVISRTLLYGALAALITAVYVGIVVGLGTLVGQGSRPNLGLSIVATAVVAVGFQPARERLQRVANRLVYGSRATPYEVLSEFSTRVAESYSADEVLPRMAKVLAEGTGASAATVWLHDRPVASFGSDGQEPDTRKVDVRHQGELLGALSLRKPRGESLAPLEEKLLEDLAHQAGLVLKNVGLTADLQARLLDLRESRQRLVAAQDLERRRLERDLHDGAQQHLVALKVKLGLVDALATKDPDRSRATLRELKADVDEALEALRDLARGIYPPILHDNGLSAALQAHARKATLPVRVEGDSIGRYPQEVEAAVYFCVLEALQNAQKYAQASEVTVRLRADDVSLAFKVEDDGRGFDPTVQKKGSGRQNMEDRLDALGGTLTLLSTPGKGTIIAGRLPIAPFAQNALVR